MGCILVSYTYTEKTDKKTNTKKLEKKKKKRRQLSFSLKNNETQYYSKSLLISSTCQKGIKNPNLTLVLEVEYKFYFFVDMHVPLKLIRISKKISKIKVVKFQVKLAIEKRKFRSKSKYYGLKMFESVKRIKKKTRCPYKNTQNYSFRRPKEPFYLMENQIKDDYYYYYYT